MSFGGATVSRESLSGGATARLMARLAATGEKEAAVTELLTSFRMDRKWNEEAARKQLVQLFDAWGPKDDLTVEGRRRLSSILFA